VHVPQENGQMIRSIPHWNDDSHFMLQLTLDWFVPPTDFDSRFSHLELNSVFVFFKDGGRCLQREVLPFDCAYNFNQKPF
jgi:hypothetical protein